jgi:hypothetical protein
MSSAGENNKLSLLSLYYINIQHTQLTSCVCGLHMYSFVLYVYIVYITTEPVLKTTKHNTCIVVVKARRNEPEGLGVDTQKGE